jgi:microcystin-dependent protein
MGSGHTLGERGGEQGHTLSISEIPTHVHSAQGTSTSVNTVAIATNNVLAGANNLYGPPSNLTSLLPATLANVGGSQAHLNMQPFLVLNFCIALQGIFPSQS